LVINEEVLVYLSVDFDTDMITLATPLTVAASGGDHVAVYPYGAQWVAMVDLADGDEGVRALIVNEQERWRDGIRNEGEQESVLISDETGRWEVKSIDEEIPVLDGGFID